MLTQNATGRTATSATEAIEANATFEGAAMPARSPEVTRPLAAGELHLTAGERSETAKFEIRQLVDGVAEVVVTAQSAAARLAASLWAAASTIAKKPGFVAAGAALGMGGVARGALEPNGSSDAAYVSYGQEFQGQALSFKLLVPGVGTGERDTSATYLNADYAITAAHKGGTALNLFAFRLPRLSVDIDLNYVGAVDREDMLAERPKVDQAMGAVFAREGFTVNRQPAEHAGGKWRLRYAGALGGGGNLEVDLNFMLRLPLWPVMAADSHPLGSAIANSVPLLDLHELAAGKLAALLSRTASRDLFDAHQLLTTQPLDPAKLRLGFVLYGAMNRKDWRTVSSLTQ